MRRCRLLFLPLGLVFGFLLLLRLLLGLLPGLNFQFLLRLVLDHADGSSSSNNNSNSDRSEERNALPKEKYGPRRKSFFGAG